MKKQIITIAGAPGAGKSSTAKLVAQELGYRHFSSGDLFRQIAKERGLTIEQINEAAEIDSSVDHDVDEHLRALGKEENIVIDSRLAYHWIPDSYKVYLDLDMQSAVERTFEQIKSEGRESQSADSIETLLAATQSRKEMERNRYQNLYHIDLADLSPFDLVVDTKAHDLKGVVQIITEKYRQFLEN